MAKMTNLVLRTALGNYGHTTTLKDGTITSPQSPGGGSEGMTLGAAIDSYRNGRHGRSKTW